MLNTRRKCDHPGCTKFPLCGPPGGKAIRCVRHKESTHINLHARRCELCEISASFGFPGERKPLRCVEHKLPGMLNVVNAKCPCGKFATFGTTRGGTATNCSRCREPGMFSCNRRLCELCNRCARHTLEGESTKRFCSDHRTGKVVDLSAYRCISKGCRRKRMFGFRPKGKPLWCKFHKEGNAVDLTSKQCIDPECKLLASFAEPGQPVIHCSMHATETEVNLTAPRCKMDGCWTTIGTKKYRGYCLRCFIHLFPDEPVSTGIRTKEKAFHSWFKATYPNLKFTIDRKIEGGCSLRRPDILIDLGEYILIVELDENQHSSYSERCEERRVNEIYADEGCRPVMFLRINPDSFVDSKGRRHQSCFPYHQRLGVPLVDEKRWTERLNVLKSRIGHWLSTKPTEQADEELLFYNGYEVNESFE